MLLLALCTAGAISAQKPVTHKAAHAHKAKPSTAESVVPVVVPPAPKMPDWPANNAPQPPSVTWDSQGLRVNATNSSLRQILNEVSTTTGSKISGLGSDERIFGTYGPGPARDVLSQILHGTGYNVLMLGDQGQGTPREVVLSPRNSTRTNVAANQPNQSAQQDDDIETEPDEQPQQAQPQPPFARPQPGQPGIPGPLHTPQERMMEMQRQQMEMQRQQQQQLQQMQEQQNQQQQ